MNLYDLKFKLESVKYALSIAELQDLKLRTLCILRYKDKFFSAFLLKIDNKAIEFLILEDLIEDQVLAAPLILNEKDYYNCWYIVNIDFDLLELDWRPKVAKVIYNIKFFPV